MEGTGADTTAAL
jgi:hypothetical protein